MRKKDILLVKFYVMSLVKYFKENILRCKTRNYTKFNEITKWGEYFAISF